VFLILLVCFFLFVDKNHVILIKIEIIYNYQTKAEPQFTWYPDLVLWRNY
jgi:hypothetical protein